MTDNWTKVDDEIVRHLWIGAGGEISAVKPNYYDTMGVPFDPEADCVMTYHLTEVNMSALDHRLAVIASSFKENGMFHTPASKEEATNWCATQGSDRMVGFMVGYNYAVEMLRQIIDGTHPGLQKGDTDA
jgi:hypothetical protein